MNERVMATGDTSALLSCGVSALYASGGFPGDDDTLRALALREASDGAPDFLGELFPAAAYERPPPNAQGIEDLAFGGLAEHIRREINAENRVSPASGLVALDDAVLIESVLFAGPPGNRRLVYETARPSDRIVNREWRETTKLKPFSAAQGPALFIGSVGSFNYGHWLIDDLPRLRAVDLLRARYPGDTVTIVLIRYGGRIDAVREQSIRLYLPPKNPVRIAFVPRNEATGFKRLYYPTPVSHHPFTKSPGAVSDLVRTLRRSTVRQRKRIALRRKLVARRPALPTKIFVDRRASRTRQLINKAEIIAELKTRGFEIVDVEAMSVAQQVSYFAHARVVVGVLGAAMTNTVFCRPGAHVVYLAPDGWFDPFFWDLAALRRHPYHALFGRPEEGAAPHPYERSFTLPWPILAATLDRVDRETAHR